jgi:hypothetical protein
MTEIPECPRCSRLLVSATTPLGGRARNRPFPDRSTGYCTGCHIGVTKIKGAWVATPVALAP